MKNAILVAVLAGGILLLLFGAIAYDSGSSDLSRFFTGTATDKSIWMLASGVMAIIFSVLSLSRGTKRS